MNSGLVFEPRKLTLNRSVSLSYVLGTLSTSAFAKQIGCCILMRSSADIELFGLPGRTNACVPATTKRKKNKRKNLKLINALRKPGSNTKSSLEPDALGKLSTELAKQANAWLLMLPRSVLSCDMLKPRETSLAPLNFRVASLNVGKSFGEFRTSFGCFVVANK